MDVKNSFFYVIFTIIFGIACAFLWHHGYYMSFIILNHFRASWADVYFSKITHLGDGITFTSIFFLLYGRKDISKTLALILCLVITTIIVQLMKNLFFSNWYRPLVVYGENLVNYIKGYQAYGMSFPSGHTTAFFTIIFCLVQWRKWHFIWQLIWIILGISVAFSRIYLGVHFLGDVVAGIVIAGIVSHAFFNFFVQKLEFLNNNIIWKRSLILISSLSLIMIFILRVIFEKNF